MNDTITTGRAEDLQRANRDTIARFNDETRCGIHSQSRIVMTAGLQHILAEDGNTAGARFAHEIVNQRALLRLINETPIDPGNDPHGERDFGVVVFKDQKVFWKIDTYANDGSFSFGSDAPWDPARTFRIMTIMLASEY